MTGASSTSTLRLGRDWPSSAKLVLRVLEDSDEPLTATEVATRAGLSDRTAQRWCRQLWLADRVEVVVDVDDLRKRPYCPANRHE